MVDTERDEDDPIEELQGELEQAEADLASNESLASPVRKYLRFTVLPLIRKSTELWIERTDELGEGLDGVQDEIDGTTVEDMRAALNAAAALAVEVLATANVEPAIPVKLKNLAIALTQQLDAIRESEEDVDEAEIAEATATLDRAQAAEEPKS